MNDIFSMLGEVTEDNTCLTNHPFSHAEIQKKISYLNGLALVANIDGDVCDDETSYLRTIINTFELPTDDTLDQVLEFARNPDKETMQEIFKVFDSENQKYTFLLDCLMLAYQNGTLENQEDKIIDMYSANLGMSRDILINKERGTTTNIGINLKKFAQKLIAEDEVEILDMYRDNFGLKGECLIYFDDFSHILEFLKIHLKEDDFTRERILYSLIFRSHIKESYLIFHEELISINYIGYDLEGDDMRMVLQYYPTEEISEWEIDNRIEQWIKSLSEEQLYALKRGDEKKYEELFVYEKSSSEIQQEKDDELVKLAEELAEYKTERFYSRFFWVEVDDNIATIGMTSFKSDSIGEIAYIDLPEVDSRIYQNSKFLEGESVSQMFNLPSPISGKVVSVNIHLEDSPESIYESPDTTWIIEVEMSEPNETNNLMTEEQYQDYIA